MEVKLIKNQSEACHFEAIVVDPVQEGFHILILVL